MFFKKAYIGTLTAFKAKIRVDPSAQPKYCKLYRVPIFMRLTRWNYLVAKGTLEPVEVAGWAASITLLDYYLIKTKLIVHM